MKQKNIIILLYTLDSCLSLLFVTNGLTCTIVLKFKTNNTLHCHEHRISSTQIVDKVWRFKFICFIIYVKTEIHFYVVPLIYDYTFYTQLLCVYQLNIKLILHLLNLVVKMMINNFNSKTFRIKISQNAPISRTLNVDRKWSVITMKL